MTLYTFFLIGTFITLISIISLLLWLQTKYRLVQEKVKTIQVSLVESQELVALQQNENIDLIKKIATLEAEKNALEEKIKTYKEEDRAREDKLSLQFNKLANELLKKGGEKLVVENKSQLESLLLPLKEKIMTFEKQVVRTHEETLARNIALRTELVKMNELNMKITQEAKNLTNAIKGDTKVQGNWGEFVLESLLEKSGLVKDREYIIQEAFTTSEGKRYRPDVVVKLPENKSVVIDAKVSLTHYEAFFNADDPQEKKIYIKKHIQSIRNHIKELAKKNYAQEYNLVGLDFVLMFVPIEAAFSLAVQHEPALFQEAYKQNIVLLTPSSLMGTLRMIAHIWKTEYQNRNAREMASYCGAFFDKCVSVIENLKKIGHQLNLTQKTWETTMKQASEGRGNLLSKLDRIKTLGARTNKELPSVTP